MNKKALATFLRQFLCLLLIIKLASGIIYCYSPRACLKEKKGRTMLPFNKFIEDSYQIGKNAIFCYCFALGCLMICWSFIGLIGVICLHSRQLINFSFGVGSVLSSILEFTASDILDKFLKMYEDLIINPIKIAFNATNRFTAEAIVEYEHNTSALFNQKYVQGWNRLTRGTAKIKAYVDFIQFNLQCCGFGGRQFWDTSIPRSCCSQEYFGSYCKLATAYSEACVENYNSFISCLSAIKTLFILFGIISVITGVVALVITQMQILYPDDENKSDTSSDTDGTIY